MRIKLVLVGIEGEINLGFILRLAVNFEADKIVLVDPLATDFDEVRRFAAKAGDLVKDVLIVEDLESAFDDDELRICTTAKIGQEGDVLRHTVSPGDLPGIISGRDKIALVFGRESTGLTRRELACCDVLVNIPTSKRYPALNLSHAVSILLYELYLYRKKGLLKGPKPAGRELLDFLIKSFEDIVNVVVEDESKKSRAVIAFRRLVTKGAPTSGEAKILSYVLKRAWRRLSQ